MSKGQSVRRLHSAGGADAGKLADVGEIEDNPAAGLEDLVEGDGFLGLDGDGAVEVADQLDDGLVLFLADGDVHGEALRGCPVHISACGASSSTTSKKRTLSSASQTMARWYSVIVWWFLSHQSRHLFSTATTAST